MSPGHSRGGPLTTDRPTAEALGEKTAADATRHLGQPPPRRTEPVNVWAHAYLVVGHRGRCRLALMLRRCPCCSGGRPHVHNGKPDFTAGKRTASCRLGRYVMHVSTLQGEVAA